MAGIYIHIPFCRQKCHYCNFHFSTSLAGKQDLLNAIHRELALQANFLPNLNIQTIYIGGGTPSLLLPNEIFALFDALAHQYPLNYLQEVTLEANPDDLHPNFLRSLRQTPVNRLSIGVQSFFEPDLQFMNRAHNANQAQYAIKAAQDAGFENLNIDLIYGTPSLSNDKWLHNLAQLQALQIPHCSAYALTVEEGTLLHHNIKHQNTPPPDDAQAAAQFNILIDQTTAAGYDHYEISNFALPNHHAIHNTNYWRGIPYLGIGPSAHSFNGALRQWNIANNALYTHSLLHNNLLLFEQETLTPKDHINEYIMTSLRTMWGCDLAKIDTLGGDIETNRLRTKAAPFQRQNLLNIQNNHLILTKAGKLFADRIAAALFAEE